MAYNFAETSRYVVGSKSIRPDPQKPRQLENAARDIAIYREVVHICEKCVEINGDYIEK
jgi:hypothetical protein